MKRYILFTGDTYYPGKAWQDYKATADTIEELKELLIGVNVDWWQIVDLTTGTIVAGDKA